MKIVYCIPSIWASGGMERVLSVKANWLVRHGYDEGIKLQEDELFLLSYARFCDRMKCVNSVGYYYNVPDWGGKYVINYEEEENRLLAMYEYISVLDKCKKTVLYQNIIGSLCELYEREFMKFSYKRRSSMKKIRRIVVENFSLVRITMLMRVLIYLDITCLFSSILFLIKGKAKKVLG